MLRTITLRMLLKSKHWIMRCGNGALFGVIGEELLIAGLSFSWEGSKKKCWWTYLKSPFFTELPMCRSDKGIVCLSLSPQAENTEHSIVPSLCPEENKKRKYDSCHFIKCHTSCPDFGGGRACLCWIGPSCLSRKGPRVYLVSEAVL